MVLTLDTQSGVEEVAPKGALTLLLAEVRCDLGSLTFEQQKELFEIKSKERALDRQLEWEKEKSKDQEREREFEKFKAQHKLEELKLAQETEHLLACLA